MTVFLWGLVASLGVARGAEPLAMSIEEALGRALDTSESVAAATAGVSSAQGDRWSARSGFLPSVSASLSYQRTFASPFDELLSGFSPGPTGGTGTPTPTGTGTGTGNGGSGTLPFGQPNTWQTGLQIGQSLFAGGRTRAAVHVARAGSQSAEIGLEGARASAALDTVSAYYDAVLSDRLLEIATSTREQAETTVTQTALAHEVGRQPEFDVLRAQVAVANQDVSVIAAARQRDLALWRLAQLLDVPTDQPLALTSSLDEPAVAGTAAEVAQAAPPSGTPAGVRQLQALRDLSAASVKVTRAAGLPSVALSASIGWVAYPSSIWPLGTGRTWYASSNAAVALTVPLFNGGRVLGDVRHAKADLARAQTQVELGREAAALSQLSAQADLDAARAQSLAAANAVEQARRAYAIAELRFAEGVSTQLELTDARLQLERALVNEAQSARDVAVARTRLALIASLPLTGR